MAIRREELRKAAEDAGLKVGVTVKIDYREKEDGKGGGYLTKTAKGEVLALYPNIFLCQLGKIKVSFRYSELLGEGRMVRL